MSTWNDPGKVEDAMKAVVDALTLDVYTGDSPATEVVVNTGQEDDDLALPSVVCAVQDGGEEFIRFTGNFRSPVIVRVSSSAKITKEQHRARCATVFDAFLQSDIKDTLSAAVDDFRCFHVIPQAPTPTRREPRGDEEGTFMFVSELALEIFWCGSDDPPPEP